MEDPEASWQPTGMALRLCLLAGLPLLADASCKPSPTVAFDPPRWDFGTVAYGSSASQSVTITNTSGYDLQVALNFAPPGVRVTGLPIPNLASKASAQLQLTLNPMFNESDTFNESVSLLIGGYSGSEWGDVSGGVDLDVTGDTTASQACNPQLIGYATEISQLNPDVDFVLGEDGLACTSEGGPDGGSTCISASECTSFCCLCPLDCADFTAQACVLGSCARTPVACDIAQSAGSVVPAACPDGGHPPSAVLGPFAFAVGGSGAKLEPTLRVTLSRAASAACLDAGVTPGLEFTLPAGSEIEPDLFQIGSGAASALLDDPNSGSLVAIGGYAYLTERSAGGVAGSFDIQFPGGSAGEAWGHFNAPICP